MNEKILCRKSDNKKRTTDEQKEIEHKNNMVIDNKYHD